MKDIRRRMWKLNQPNRPTLGLQNLNTNFLDYYKEFNPQNTQKIFIQDFSNRKNNSLLLGLNRPSKKNYGIFDDGKSFKRAQNLFPNNSEVSQLRHSLDPPAGIKRKKQSNLILGQRNINSPYKNKLLRGSSSISKKPSPKLPFSHIKQILKNPSDMHIAGDIRNPKKAYDLNEAYNSNKIRGYRSDKVTKKFESRDRNQYIHPSKRRNGPSAWELINYDSENFKEALREKEQIRQGLEFIRMIKRESPKRKVFQLNVQDVSQKKGGNIEPKRKRRKGVLRDNKSLVYKKEYLENKPRRKLNQSSREILKGDYDMFEDYNLKKRKEKMILDLVLNYKKNPNIRMKKTGLLDVKRREIIPAGVKSEKSESPDVRFHEKARKDYEKKMENRIKVIRKENTRIQEKKKNYGVETDQRKNENRQLRNLIRERYQNKPEPYQYNQQENSPVKRSKTASTKKRGNDDVNRFKQYDQDEEEINLLLDKRKGIF